MRGVRAVVLATDPGDGNAGVWCEQLRAHGVSTTLLTHEPRTLPPADFVVAHLLLAAGRAPHPAWAAARRYEQAGVALLNSTASLALCADKWRTHRAWDRAGLPQPATWRLAALETWPDEPVLIKPAYGESARGICVVEDRAAARRAAAGWVDDALVQQVVRCRSVLRVHATRWGVIGAHARPASALAGLPEPDPRERPVPVTPELRALACGAVRAVGGGLVGLDLIEARGRLLLLEANPPFLMPGHLPGLLQAIVGEAIARCASPSSPARDAGTPFGARGQPARA